MKRFQKYRTTQIVKASGEIAEFDRGKLVKSLKKSGASSEQIEKIVLEIETILHPGITTRKIYRKAFNLLRSIARPMAARYKLKSAIMELGPSGFPFEKYISAILHYQGYHTQTGVIIEGKCVKHEVDVIAEREHHHYMIECKYHNQPGTVCDVKIPLYINSRFKDVEASWVKLPGHEIKLHQGWVVTNTRFTSDAVQYGTCAGLYLLGWNHPENNGLNQLIEKIGLYPITCLTTLSKSEKQELLNSKVVLCREVCDRPELLQQIGIEQNRASSVLEEGKELCQKIFQHG